MIRAQSVSLAFGSLVSKLPESTWSGVVVDENRWVLDVGRDSSFVRKIKATQKMDVRGVCMLWVVSMISGGLEIAASLYQKRA